MVNAKLALFAVLAAAATFVSAADDESAANNGTAPATNGTVLDDGSATNGTAPATNGTATNGTEPATNGTATNGTATNGTTPPTPSGGSTRRSLQACEYGCPFFSLAGTALVALLPRDDGTFACRFESDCTYQTNTGVLSSGDANVCPGAAVPLVAGCVAGRSDNGGVVRRSRHKRRSSAEMQFEALAKRLGL